MLSTVIRSLFPSASSDGTPDFGGRWSPITGGYHGAYATTSGEIITDSSVYAIAAWFACIRNISEDIAKLPLGVYERDDDSRLPSHDHEVAKALRRPNPDMSSFSLRETWVQHALGFGDGYMEIAEGPGGVIQLWPLDPTRTLMVRENGRTLYRYRDPETQMEVEFQSKNVLHLHGLGPDGRRGYSMAMMFREMLGTVMANLKVTGAIWNNGLFVGGVLQHPGALGDDALRNLRNSFEQRHGGSKNAGRLMILEEGMTFNQLAIDPERAQLIEQRQFDVEEVARVYRMPLHKIGHLLRATFTNIEHQAREYVVDCLLPWITRAEQEYDRKLLIDDDDYYTKHNVMGLLRGDEAARSDYYMKMVQLGMPPNRILALEDQPGIGPEGDISYIAMNIRPQTPEARKAAMQKPAAPIGQQPPVGDQPDPDMPRDKGGRPKESIAASYVEAIETILEPLARKEVNAISKMAQKYFNARDRFISGVEKFYIEHAEHMRCALEPATGALVAILDGERDDPSIDVQVRALISADIDCKKTWLWMADFPQGIDRLTETWPTRENNKLANDAASVALLLVRKAAV